MPLNFKWNKQRSGQYANHKIHAIFRYDFDGDNMIAPEEVYILLSYIPFKTHDQSSNAAMDSPKSPKKAAR